METQKKRTITMTDRRPISIVEDDWKVIAVGKGDSYSNPSDYSRYQQALMQGELDRYILKVRQHADGRVIVNGVFDAASAWTGNEDHRGGELLTPGEDIVAAIRRVGEECGLPDSIIRDCIADLPAEEI